MARPKLPPDIVKARRKAWQKKYYEEHRADYAARARKWRKNNPDAARESVKQWQLRNPDAAKRNKEDSNNRCAERIKKYNRVYYLRRKNENTTIA